MRHEFRRASHVTAILRMLHQTINSDNHRLLHLVRGNGAHLLDAITTARPGSFVRRGIRLIHRNRFGRGLSVRAGARHWFRRSRFTSRGGWFRDRRAFARLDRRRFRFFFLFLSSKHYVYSWHARLRRALGLGTPEECVPKNLLSLGRLYFTLAEFGANPRQRFFILAHLLDRVDFT